MGRVPPEHCHYYGGQLSEIEPPTVHRCRACEEYVFYDPTPAARVARPAAFGRRRAAHSEPRWGRPSRSSSEKT